MAFTGPLVTQVSSRGVSLGCACAFEAASATRITVIIILAIRMVCIPFLILFNPYIKDCLLPESGMDMSSIWHYLYRKRIIPLVDLK
jgi:hypothetical protein